MIDLTKPNQWQRTDPENGLVEPWLTFPALDEIKTWDLKDKIVFEYGCGASTLWWDVKCKTVFAVENIREVLCHVLDNTHCRISFETEKERFVTSPYQWETGFDIIVIDCDPIEWRNDCIQPALECLKDGGKLIIDNWMQPSCDWMVSKENQKLLTSFPYKIFKQPGHQDWQTAIFYKPS